MHDCQCASILDSIAKKTSCSHNFCMLHAYVNQHAFSIMIFTLVIKYYIHVRT